MKKFTKIRIGLIMFIILLFAILIFLIYDRQLNLGGYKIDSYSSPEHFISLDKEGDTAFINSLGFARKGTKITYIAANDSISIWLAIKDSRVLEPYIYFDEIRQDKKFILLIQRPLTGWDGKYTYPEDDYKDTTIVYNKKIPIWFFVINKMEDIIYGPYTLDQYIEKRKEIGIPDSLKLRLENLDELYNFKY